MPTTRLKSAKQIRFLLGSKALSDKQKSRLKRELHTGKVRVKK